ncbi:DUF308 domain-containing protein [Nibrella saemangeumensis]
MERRHIMPHWWLLLAKSALFIVIGLLTMLVGDEPSSATITIVGVMFIIAGVCHFVFSLPFRQLDRSYWFHLIQSVADIGFGVSILLMAVQEARVFMDNLGFWALIYGAILTTQAMFNFLSLRAGRADNLSPRTLQAIAAAIAVSLAFFLMLFGPRNAQAWLWIGIHFIALGGIYILNTLRLRASFGQGYYDQTYQNR